MSELIIPFDTVEKLPFSVSNHLATLPAEAQQEFLIEYKRSERTSIVGYLLQFTFWAHYAYYEQWLLQVLFWITGGGFGLWWFIDLFRIPAINKEYNQKLADRILRRVSFKYKGQKTNAQRTIQDMRTEKVAPKPRNFYRNAYDPAYPTVEHLNIGFLLDCEMQTWQVSNIRQYDYDSGYTERDLKLNSGNEKAHLYLSWEGQYLEVVFAKRINLHRLAESLEIAIKTERTPHNVIDFEGVTYYRESPKEGTIFELSVEGSPYRRTLVWEYYDDSHTQYIRIERQGSDKFKAAIGKRIADFEITQILPKNKEEEF
ncbi:MAG: DUF4178 domain-containing protein [Bernardetiaceae bacterium]|nr:DUF4178 domain-containing protein [Bernardetiaceae bacterium]